MPDDEVFVHEFHVPEAELHEFRGRLFVTSGWGEGWGCAVDSEDGHRMPSEVGTLLVEALRRSRGPDADGWDLFCGSVAGVPVEKYRPERRVQIADLDRKTWKLLQPDHFRPPEGSHEVPAEAGPAGLGATALALLRAQEANWPEVESAAIHVASRKRLVIYPQIFLAGPPVYVVSIDDSHEAIGSLVGEALSASPFVGDEAACGRWEAALASQGVERSHMARRRAASVGVRSDGTVRVSAYRAMRGGWEPIPGAEVVLPDRDPMKLGRAVVVAVRDWNPWGGSQLGSEL